MFVAFMFYACVINFDDIYFLRFRIYTFFFDEALSLLICNYLIMYIAYFYEIQFNRYIR